MLPRAVPVDAGEGPEEPEEPAPDAGARMDGGEPTGGDGGTGTCGDGTCAGESCTDCPRDCGSCCSNTGGRSCGGNGISGSPDTLYRCDGTRYVPHETCSGPCVVLPSGVPDRCPLGPPPAGLVTQLSVKPYVEGSCQSVNWPGWPHAAQACSYSASGRSATVAVANPPAEVVAKWVVDASAFIRRLRALQTTHPAEWEQGLSAMARHMLLQSSRIFPLEGGVIEDMGSGPVVYPFLKGVTQGCSSGCFCRINSMDRTTYCRWREAMGGETEASCLQRVGSSGHTSGWADQCLGNHARAWTADWNEHFRAMAWSAGKSVSAACPTASACTPAQVVAEVRAAYGP
ncbi:MAG: hypothetical protein FJ086_01380 [Deltaproteobacteria bacterium]|nr:hypothetical protein [Deltaproteobacteria bacterium]